MKIRIHAFVSGKVQGVFFRASTREEAERLGLRGWVKNLPDGRVELVAEGEDESIRKLIGFLHKGPPRAGVEKVIIKKETFKGQFSTFSLS